MSSLDLEELEPRKDMVDGRLEMCGGWIIIDGVEVPLVEKSRKSEEGAELQSVAGVGLRHKQCGQCGHLTVKYGQRHQTDSEERDEDTTHY